MSNELTFHEREMLQYWLRTKLSIRKIAKVMQRDHSVIVREINRNSKGDRNTYRADTAQRLGEKRKHNQHIGKIDKYPELRKYIEEKLNLDWSPEQIAGRLNDHSPGELKTKKVSHETIYYYIYEKAERHKKLHLHLRTYRSKRRKQGKRRSRKIAIPGRISIHKRPLIIDKKERFGDWESDTVEFQRKNKNGYLSVQYERKSQLVRIHKMNTKSAEETKNALIKTAESLEPDLFKTITFDNGTEGTKHLELKEYYPNLETYFCDPFCSWQKGGVENLNKLIRQYLPRNTNLNNLTDLEIYNIEEKINNRPRKGLNYLSPNEVIHKSGARKA